MGGVAMKFLADKFTGGDTGKVEDFLLSAHPEQLQQLKIADIEFRREMAKLGVDLERIAVDDRKDARDLAKTRGLLVQAALSVFYTVGYFSVFFAFIFGKVQVDENYTEMVVTLIGALGAAQLQVLNFWFGSSSGSREKTFAMAERS